MVFRTVSGALALTAAGLIMAAGTPAHAEAQPAPTRATWSHGSAAATVNSDGSLSNGTNIRRTWRTGTGRYCVQLGYSVDSRRSFIQLTPREARRLPHVVYRRPSVTCPQHNTVTVNVYDTSTGRLSNGGFDLLAL
ncbi:hypothetical protein HII36_19435 [Nonomuraea sp. NN258]|uniref:hypothetical protein n=1 Tax=Nonomuraea antri TaxID=2730852 RepID=UPI001568E1F0|nr:hypothetical protein [Nonomuraea antri]NRQ34008.1 hypothetical protein [Nonomuraea antri]